MRGWQSTPDRKGVRAACFIILVVMDVVVELCENSEHAERNGDKDTKLGDGACEIRAPED